MLVKVLLSVFFTSALAQKGKGRNNNNNNNNGASSQTTLGAPMNCSGVPVCGVLSLRSGFVNNGPRQSASVQGLWPQVGDLGNSECRAPRNRANSTQVATCVDPESPIPSEVLLVTQNNEWIQHGQCAGVQNASDYFNQICALAAPPLARINGLGNVAQMAEALNVSGYEVFRALPDLSFQLSACLRVADGQWILAPREQFVARCLSNGTASNTTNATGATGAAAGARSSAPTSQPSNNRAATAAAAVAATGADAGARSSAPTSQPSNNRAAAAAAAAAASRTQQPSFAPTPRSGSVVAVVTTTTTISNSTTSSSNNRGQGTGGVGILPVGSFPSQAPTPAGPRNFTLLAAQILPACALKNTCLYIIPFPLANETSDRCSFFVNALQRCLSLDPTCNANQSLSTIRTCCEADQAGRNASSVCPTVQINGVLSAPLLSSVQGPWPNTFQAAGIVPSSTLAFSPVSTVGGATTFLPLQSTSSSLPVINSPAQSSATLPVQSFGTLPAQSTSTSASALPIQSTSTPAQSLPLQSSSSTSTTVSTTVFSQTSSSALPLQASSSSALPLQASSSSALPLQASSSSALPLQASSSSALPLQASALPLQASSSSALPLQASSSSALPLQASSSSALPLQASALPSQAPSSSALPLQASSSSALPLQASALPLQASALPLQASALPLQAFAPVTFPSQIPYSPFQSSSTLPLQSSFSSASPLQFSASALPLQSSFTSTPLQSSFTSTLPLQPSSSLPLQSAYSTLPLQSSFTDLPLQSPYTSFPLQSSFAASAAPLASFGAPLLPAVSAPLSAAVYPDTFAAAATAAPSFVASSFPVSSASIFYPSVAPAPLTVLPQQFYLSQPLIVPAPLVVASI